MSDFTHDEKRVLQASRIAEAAVRTGLGEEAQVFQPKCGSRRWRFGISSEISPVLRALVFIPPTCCSPAPVVVVVVVVHGCEPQVPLQYGKLLDRSTPWAHKGFTL